MGFLSQRQFCLVLTRLGDLLQLPVVVVVAVLVVIVAMVAVVLIVVAILVSL